MLIVLIMCGVLQGKFDEAAEHFILGGQPKEAVLM